LVEVEGVALDDRAELSARRAALQTLITKRPPELRGICERLLTVPFLNMTAVRGLALFDDPLIGERLAGNYWRYPPSERGSVTDTLVSRPAFVAALLDEMSEGHIPRADLTPFHARQIKSFGQEALSRRLLEVWGAQRDTSADVKQTIAGLREKLTPSVLVTADRAQGRVLFQKTCANCHTLYGEGGHVGPDLTGSGRDNLDYLLENIVDPSAVVNADFRMSVVSLKDGRTLNALVAARSERTITLKTMTETLTIERAAIEGMQESSLSLMPEGLLSNLTDREVRDLFGYLMSRTPP